MPVRGENSRGSGVQCSVAARAMARDSPNPALVGIRMRLRHLLVAGLFAVPFALPATAHAGKDMKGRFGLGAQRTLSGASELHARWFLLERLSLGFGTGMWFHTDDFDNDDDRDPRSAFSISPSVFGWFLRTKETGPVAANLGIGGRFTMVIHNGNNNTVVEPIMEVPLTVEVYVGQHFAIAPEAGVAFRINSGGDDEAFTNTINAGSGSAIMGGGSFHFYF